MTHGHHIAVLQRMLFDQLAVDVCAIGAVQVLKERVVEDVDDERVMTADGRVIDGISLSGKRPTV